MKSAIRAAFIVVTALSLLGCDGGQTNEAKFVKLVSENRIGSSPGYWLVKPSQFKLDTVDKIAFIYGLAMYPNQGSMGDGNKILCETIAASENKTWGSGTYQCEIAN
jgi:hypothetical protein